MTESTCFTVTVRAGAFNLVRTHLGLGGGGGVKSPIHSHCVLHAKMWEGVQIACQIAYVLNRRAPFPGQISATKQP